MSNKIIYNGNQYEVIKTTKTDVQIRRVNSKSGEPVATLKIGSDRYNKMFLGQLDGTYNQILDSEAILEVNLSPKQLDDRNILDFTDLIETLKEDSGYFKSKTAATVWCMEALNGEAIELRYRNPLYAILYLYYNRTKLLKIDEDAIAEYLKLGFIDKYTNWMYFTEMALSDTIGVKELYTYIPDDYETIVSEFMLGKVRLNVTLMDLKYILKQYKNKRMEQMGQTGLAKLNDETVKTMALFFKEESEKRGFDLFEGTSTSNDSLDLVELLDSYEVEDILNLVKERCSVKIKATKKTLSLDPEDLAALLEEKLDEEELEELMEALQSLEDDEDSEEEEDDEDSEEEEDDEDSEEEEDDEDSEEEEEDDEDSEEEEDDEDSEEEEDDEDSEEEELTLAELLAEAMEDSDILDILEDAEIEVKLTAKQKKLDAEDLAEVLEKKLDEDDLETLIDYLDTVEDSEEEEEEEPDEDEEDSEEEDEEDISIDSLSKEEILELAEEEGLKVPAKPKASDIKKLRKELKELFED